MAGRHGTGYLTSTYQQNVQFLGLFFGDVERTVVAGHDVFAVGTVFDVLGERDGIESFTVGFVHPHGGPHESVGKDGVHVEVALQGGVSFQIGHLDFVALLRLYGGCPQQGEQHGTFGPCFQFHFHLFLVFVIQ